MRLVTFVPPVARARPRVGAVADLLVVDLAAAAEEQLVADGLPATAARRLADALLPADMTDFLENGVRSLNAARSAVEWILQRQHTAPGLGWPTHEVRLLSPVPNPPNFRDCNIFEGHTLKAAQRMGSGIHPNWYEVPAYYKGTRSSIAGPDTVLAWPEPSEKVDLEFEYAAVIGRQGKNIAAADAFDYIAGFTICNDLSARDLQGREMPLLLGPGKGKDFDGSTVLGPALVTLDEIDDPNALAMTARINGRVICEAVTGSAYWSWGQIIEHLSRNEMLLPGDVIASGTVAGGSLLESDGPFLQPGDVVELEVERLGVLRTTIGSRS